MALLFAILPEVQPMLENMVCMGGACGIGNTNPVAEFNMQMYPEAAALVFNSDCPLAMVPLEVTHTAFITPHVLQRIRSCATPASANKRELADRNSHTRMKSEHISCLGGLQESKRGVACQRRGQRRIRTALVNGVQQAQARWRR